MQNRQAIYHPASFLTDGAWIWHISAPMWLSIGSETRDSPKMHSTLRELSVTMIAIRMIFVPDWHPAA
jgi:hypothetical protein